MWVQSRFVCAVWGSCQHGRERAALEPARPPTRAPLHSGSGAWGWCQPNWRGRTNKRQEAREREEAFHDTSRELLSEIFRQAGPGNLRRQPGLGNLRESPPCVPESEFNLQLTLLQLREDTVHIKRVARVRRVAQFYTCSCFFLDATLVQTDAN